MSTKIEQNRETVQQSLDKRAAERTAAAEEARQDEQERALHSLINKDSAAANAEKARIEHERLASIEANRAAAKASVFKIKRKRWWQALIHYIVHHVGLAAIVYVGYLHGLPVWASVMLGLAVVISARDRLVATIRAFPKK